MKSYHDVKNLHFSGEYMILTIDGEEKRIRLDDISSVLGRASEKEKSTFEISPSGYGIHWPLIDEDIAVDGLCLGLFTQEDQREKLHNYSQVIGGKECPPLAGQHVCTCGASRNEVWGIRCSNRSLYPLN
jgi:hypothetical protein